MFTPSFYWIVVFGTLTCAGVALILRWGKGELPLWAAGSYCIAALVVMGGLTVPYVVGGKSGVLEMVLAMLILIATLAGLSRLFAQGVGAFSSNALYGSSLTTPAVQFSTTAERLASRGEIDEAIAEYRLYMLEDGSNPNPLFSAAGLAENHGRHVAALECYEEIRERFAGNPDVWAAAALREANLRRNVLDDTELSQALYEEVLTRAPESSAAGVVAKLAESQQPTES